MRGTSRDIGHERGGQRSETNEMEVYPEVERELIGLLDHVSPDPREIDEKISEMEDRLGPRVYSELLHLLSHLEFSPLIAKSHWEKIIEHREALSSKVSSKVDFRVALLDYFVSVNQHLESPKVIEIKIFQKTQDSAIKDGLTGLYNYRYLRSELDRELKRAQRANSSLSLALFDVDHFKWYNDRNGHLEGDKALRTVARIIQEQVRETDLAARYGGEEFAVLFAGAGKHAALDVAKRICSTIESYPFPFGEHQPSGEFTISGGVATFRVDGNDSAGLIEAADRGLYMAKAIGKNQVMSAGDETREYHRMAARIPGQIQLLASETQAFVTDNISEQGFQFHCGVPFQEGDFFRFILSLEGIGREVEGMARAVRVVEDESGAEQRTVGAQIVKIPFADAMTLRKYIRSLSGSLESTLESASATADC